LRRRISAASDQRLSFSYVDLQRLQGDLDVAVLLEDLAPGRDRLVAVGPRRSSNRRASSTRMPERLVALEGLPAR
jgi:hypothetical protein